MNRLRACVVASLLPLVLLPSPGALGANGIAPRLSAGLRGVADETAAAGDALQVVVRIEAPRDVAEPIVLAPAAGDWSDAVRVDLVRAGGNSSLIRAQPEGRPAEPRATLDALRIAGGIWRFSAADTGSLEPGEYRVRVTLALEAGSGWTGEVRAEDVPLHLVAASEGDPSRGALAHARDEMQADRLEAAARVLDEALRTNPAQRELLMARAIVAERAGNLYAAAMCAAAADPAQQGPLSGHPDPELEELKTRIAAAQQAVIDGQADPAPAWTWPPFEVIARLSTRGQAWANPGAKPATARRSTAAEPSSAAPSPNTGPGAAASSAGPALPAAVGTPAAAPDTDAPRPVAATGPGSIIAEADLSEAKIVGDPAGQWATAAVASSEYSPTRHTASQATGVPNVTVAGDSTNAWCPAQKDTGTAWLEASFARPVHATEVRVRQNNTPGAIVRIEAIDTEGTTHLWWAGTDPFVAPPVRQVHWFAIRVPRTEYAVSRVRITLNLAATRGWKQIDAVQLVGAEG